MTAPDAHIPEPDQAAKGALNPAAMPVGICAKMLSRVGGQQVTEDMLRADIAAGAPTNADGTINLVGYAAWLLKEMGRGD